MQAILNTAGHFVDRQTMVWMRYLPVPIDQVWTAISTKQGLDNWWLCPVEIDLRPGGRFSHHRGDTIVGLEIGASIDFGGAPLGSVMRFEIQQVGESTLFSMIDSWAADATPEKAGVEDLNGADAHQPGGAGTPWAGVAAGWHDIVDGLETYLTGTTPTYTYVDLREFYVMHLDNHFRWQQVMQPLRTLTS